MKTVIITGGNSGLGYYCAQEIAKNQDWYIILACRNQNKAAKALEKLRAQIAKDSTEGDALEERVETMLLDLASLASIRQFTEEFARREIPPLRAIVCNAGVQFIQRQTYTEDGFDETFGVNHLGHFLLVNLLLKQLVAPGRIIFVSSDTHDPDKITGMPAPYFRNPELMAKPEQDSFLKNKSVGIIGRTAYTTSKLCNILCAYELANRLKEQKSSSEQNLITVNVFNPGLMPGSGLAQDYPPVARFVWYFILPVLRLLPKVNSIKNAGQALARMVLDPKLETVTGKYFSGWKMIPSSQESYDRAKAQQLWQKSIELTKMTAEENSLG